MRTLSEIKEMLDHITKIQLDAEHKLDEHFLMPSERRNCERSIADAARDAQVLLWVLGEEAEVAVA